MSNLFTQSIKKRVEKLSEDKVQLIRNELPTTMNMLRNATAVILYDKNIDKYWLVESREDELPEELENWTVVNRKLKLTDLNELGATRDVVLFLGEGISDKIQETLDKLH